MQLTALNQLAQIPNRVGTYHRRTSATLLTIICHHSVALNRQLYLVPMFVGHFPLSSFHLSLGSEPTTQPLTSCATISAGTFTNAEVHSGGILGTFRTRSAVDNA